MSFGSVGRIRSISSRSRCATSISFEPISGQIAKVDALLLVVLRDHVGLFGPEFDLGHVAQPHDRAAPVGDDQVFELLGRAQVGIREQVDLHQVALRPTDRRQIVVAL